jgi:hypothetical protein
MVTCWMALLWCCNGAALVLLNRFSIISILALQGATA